MKFDTKKMTAINKIASVDAPDEFFFNHNKYIPEASAILSNEESKENDDAGTANKDSEGGLVTVWLPSIVFTPVKTCIRHGPQRPGTTDKKGIEELADFFNKKLNLNDKNVDKEAEERKEEEKEAEYKDVTKDTATTTDAPKTGATMKTKTSSICSTKNCAEDIKKEHSTPKEKLGLYKTLATTHKSAGKKVVVVRSYRLATEDE